MVWDRVSDPVRPSEARLSVRQRYASSCDRHQQASGAALGLAGSETRHHTVFGQLLSSHSQRVGYAVNVVEPGGDQRYLQNRLVVEAGGTQPLMIVFPDFGRIFGDLHYVVEHDPLLGSDGSGGVILFQRIDESCVQSDPTQKLCV